MAPADSRIYRVEYWDSLGSYVTRTRGPSFMPYFYVGDQYIQLGRAGHLHFFTVGDVVAHQLFPDSPGLREWLHLFPGYAPMSVPLVWEVPVPRVTPIPTFQPHFTLAWGGHFRQGTAAETWSNRMVLTSATTLMSDAEADTALPAIVTALANLFADTNIGWTPVVSLQYVKLNRVDAAGLYVNQGATRATYIEPAQIAADRNNPGAPLPTQCCLVATLTTGVARGRAHIGRLYLPVLDPPGRISGLIDAGYAATIATKVATMIGAVNTACPGDTDVSIASTFGPAHKVTGVRVGQVVDTMRSRRRSLLEAPYGVSPAIA